MPTRSSSTVTDLILIGLAVAVLAFGFAFGAVVTPRVPNRPPGAEQELRQAPDSGTAERPDSSRKGSRPRAARPRAASAPA